MTSFRPFLNAFVLWHAKADKACRPMAEALFTLLSWNTKRPFAREIGIPTYFRSCPDGWPGGLPAGIDLDAAEHSVIFVLVESRFVIDKDWEAALLALQQAAAASGNRHRVVVVAVDRSGLQLPDAITDRLAIRLFERPAPERVRDLCLHAAAQISRVVEGTGPRGDAGVRLFISHTKRDERSLTLARRIVDLLQRESPWTGYFFDAVNIEVAEDIGETVERNIKSSTLLVVRTDGYAASPWCQFEVLAAKRHNRPIVVLDALQEREDRALPGLGNVPCVRIDDRLGDDALRSRLFEVVEATVVETMRFLHTHRKLAHLCAARRLPARAVRSARPPEDRDLRRLSPRRRYVVVYPDPALARCELEELAHPRARLTTPLTQGTRDLARRIIGVSISTPKEGLDAIGLSESHLTSAMDLIARALLSKGATLAYGGDLRPDGFTEFLGGLVRAHNAGRRDAYERIINMLPWPKNVGLDVEAIGAQAKDLSVEPVPPPEDLVAAGLADPQAIPDPNTAAGRYVCARGMLAMRERMNALIDARIVLGGKRNGFSGRYPGILEEVLLALEACKPVFVLGGFGGAAQDVAELLRGGTPSGLSVEAIARKDPHYAEMVAFHNDEVRTRGLPVPPIDYAVVVRTIRDAGLAGLNNGLSKSENRILLEVQDIEEAAWLILRGLSKRCFSDQA